MTWTWSDEGTTMVNLRQALFITIKRGGEEDYGVLAHYNNGSPVLLKVCDTEAQAKAYVNLLVKEKK
jgi:hypothetical protein